MNMFTSFSFHQYNQYHFVNSSRWISNFPEVFNLNWSVLRFNRFICKAQATPHKNYFKYLRLLGVVTGGAHGSYMAASITEKIREFASVYEEE